MVLAAFLAAAMAAESPGTDLLNIAQGAIPVGVEGRAKELRVGMSEALQMIDGDGRGFVITPKPGDMNTEISVLFELPALTTFKTFAVPNVLEIPSPSQIFFKTVTIIGHTSSEGSEEYNKDLSQRRAEAVAAAIVARGIEAGRVSARGQGEKHPIADNSSEAGRALNPRVGIECH